MQDNWDDKWLEGARTASRAERVLGALALLALAGSAVYLAAAWADLPERIPTHFNARGEADDWGSKGSLLVLPAIAAVLYAGLSAVMRLSPRYWNFPVAITAANAAAQYRNARLLMSVMRLEITLLFVALEAMSIHAARTENGELGVWVLPVVLAFIFGTIAWFVVRAFRLKG